MKLKILHAAVSMSPSVGVLKQMEWEQQAADELGLSWKTSIHTGEVFESSVVYTWLNLPMSKFLRYVVLRQRFYKWLLVESKGYDLILLRFSVHDPWQAMLSKKIGYKLLTVHHTKEEPEILGCGGVGRLKVILERLWGRLTLARVSGYVAVTSEVLAYEQSRVYDQTAKQGFIYSNGIVSGKDELIDERSGDVPELLFVASSFVPWHGLDLVLNEVKNNKSDFILHVVGSVDKNDLELCKKDHRVVTHGQLNSEQLKKLGRRCWCGLSSFALFRKGMNQACTLKVREYLDSGLPVYAGHGDSGLPGKFAFFYHGEVKLDEILAFAKKMRSVTREQVSNAARLHISKSDILANLYKQLSSKNI